MEQRGPIGPDFDWLAPMMTQGCESDLDTRTGWFPTTCDGLTRDDQDGSSDPTMANGMSCGAFCGARIRGCHGVTARQPITRTPGATPDRCRKPIRLR
jgi:hypothetical protein